MAMSETAALFDTANEYCALRQCSEAIACWEQASTLRPSSPEIHYQLGYCYAGACGEHAHRDPEIAIFHYRRALSLAGRPKSLGRAMVLGALGNAYMSASDRSETVLLNAIRCYERAAEIYVETGRLNDWAREQFNLGNAWCEMPEPEFPDKWAKAIEHYERALSVRTRVRDARHYVATLQNAGTAYRRLKSGDPSASIRKAIGCYHAALQALRGPSHDKKRGDLHQNLGNAYLSLAGLENDSVRNCRRAVRHFSRALALRNREDSPFDYAAAQFSRGQALLRLAGRGVKGDSNLDEARLSFVEAIDAFLESGNTELAHQAMHHLEVLESLEVL
jgi:tetratricopeptide (TPR) repeat protein